MAALNAGGDLVEAVAGRDDEPADVVGQPGLARRGEVGEGEVGPAGWLDHLLAERVDRAGGAVAGRVGVQLDVVADAVGRPEPDDRGRAQRSVRDDPVEQRPGVVVQRRRGRTELRVRRGCPG